MAPGSLYPGSRGSRVRLPQPGPQESTTIYVAATDPTSHLRTLGGLHPDDSVVKRGQLWLFIAPGSLRTEKRRTALIASAILSPCGWPRRCGSSHAVSLLLSELGTCAAGF